MSIKILVVEDSVETRDSLTVLLELCGYDVVVANDGQQGLARALSDAPDLIVTDVRMPAVNGIEMLRELRKHPGYRPVPVVVVTGYSKDYANEAFAAGADRVIAKPLNPEHLLRLVDNLLNESPRGDLTNL
jgi:two-component system chemotaxis response regulator CheY